MPEGEMVGFRMKLTISKEKNLVPKIESVFNLELPLTLKKSSAKKL